MDRREEAPRQADVAGRIRPMEKTHADHIQDVIDVLLLAQSQAWKVKRTMRERRITFPLE